MLGGHTERGRGRLGIDMGIFHTSAEIAKLFS